MRTEIAKRLVTLAKAIAASDEGTTVTAENQARRELADRLLASMESRDYVTVEELAVLNPGCSKAAVNQGISRVKKSSILGADMTWGERVEQAKKAGRSDPERFCHMLQCFSPSQDATKED